MTPKHDDQYNSFNPGKHLYKYWCNDCGIFWFSSTAFEDLCPNFHCESDHIFSVEITQRHKDKYQRKLEKIKKLQGKIKRISAKATCLAWVKRG